MQDMSWYENKRQHHKQKWQAAAAQGDTQQEKHHLREYINYCELCDQPASSQPTKQPCPPTHKATMPNHATCLHYMKSEE